MLSKPSDVHANSNPYRGTGGGGGGWNPPNVFVTLRYFEKFLPCYVVYKMMLILWDTYENDAAWGQ